MAVLEDHTTNRHYLYTTSPTPASGESTLYRIAHGATTIEAPEALYRYPSHDPDGDGELQISPDGRSLLLYTHGQNYGFFSHKQTTLLKLDLDAEHRPITNQQGYTSEHQYPYPYGNTGKGRLEFGVNSKDLYFVQRSLVLTFGNDSTSMRTYRQSLNTVPEYSYEIGVNYEGDLRRESDSLLLHLHKNTRDRSLIRDGHPYQTALALLTDSLEWVGTLSYQPHRIYPKGTTERETYRSVAHKNYELTDHLGNVRAVVSDVKEPEYSGGLRVGLTAEIRSYHNYYAFGMQMPGRNYNAGEYRYGFNGKENDNETGWQDYGMRMYNPRLARFFTEDPITKDYPELTPFQFASNRPIDGIDLDGLEWSKYSKGGIVTFTVKLRVITGDDVKMSREQTIEKLRNIEAVAENEFYRSFGLDVLNKNGKSEKAEYKLDIQFDLVEEEGGRKFTGTGDFTVTLHNNMLESAFSSVEGEVKRIGDTKVNNIDLAIGDIMIEGDKQFGIPEFKRDIPSMAKTFLHELGHTAGLLHTGYNGKAGYLPDELKGVKNAMDYRAMKISSKYLYGTSNIMIQGNRQAKQQFNILQYMQMESTVEESKKVGP